jgi:2-dehydropantoate 2-reductase
MQQHVADHSCQPRITLLVAPSATDPHRGGSAKHHRGSSVGDVTRPGTRPRVAVIGAGSVGGYFAAHLATAGLDVIACVRRTFDRYIVESDKRPVDHPAISVADPAHVHGTVDWVLLAVKAHQTAATTQWLEALCGPRTVVVALQNGLEAEDRISPLIPEAEVVPSVVYCSTELVAPGHIRHVSNGYLLVPDRPSMQRFAAVTSTAGPVVRVVDDYVSQAWRKLIINALVNGPGALTAATFNVYAQPAMARFGHRLIAELVGVAVAEGAKLSSGEFTPLIDYFATAQSGPSSMQQDRAAGRPTEHDAIYGCIVRAAERHGLDVPLTDSLHALVAAGD